MYFGTHVKLIIFTTNFTWNRIKAFTEDEMKRVCQKAANGNVYNDVKKNKIKIKTFHLMKDKEDKSKRYGIFRITLPKSSREINHIVWTIFLFH